MKGYFKHICEIQRLVTDTELELQLNHNRGENLFCHEGDIFYLLLEYGPEIEAQIRANAGDTVNERLSIEISLNYERPKLISRYW